MSDPVERARQALQQHIKDLEKVESDATELFESINWPLLREQKQHLLDVIGHCEGQGMKNKVEALTGILHLIDGLQDFAAGILDISDVFAETS